MLRELEKHRCASPAALYSQEVIGVDVIEGGIGRPAPPAPRSRSKPNNDEGLGAAVERHINEAASLTQRSDAGGRPLRRDFCARSSRPLIVATLVATRGNQIKAAHVLGLKSGIPCARKSASWTSWPQVPKTGGCCHRLDLAHRPVARCDSRERDEQGQVEAGSAGPDCAVRSPSPPAAAALLSGIATYLALTGAPPFGGPRPVVVLSPLNLDLILLLALAAGRQAPGGGWAGRRQPRRVAAAGSSLSCSFSLIAVLPTIHIVAVFSYLFFQFRHRESWFSDKGAHGDLQDRSRVADAYVKEHQQAIRADALGMAQPSTNMRRR